MNAYASLCPDQWRNRAHKAWMMTIENSISFASVVSASLRNKSRSPHWRATSIKFILCSVIGFSSSVMS